MKIRPRISFSQNNDEYNFVEKTTKQKTTKQQQQQNHTHRQKKKALANLLINQANTPHINTLFLYYISYGTTECFTQQMKISYSHLPYCKCPCLRTSFSCGRGRSFHWQIFLLAPNYFFHLLIVHKLKTVIAGADYEDNKKIKKNKKNKLIKKIHFTRKSKREKY